MTGGRQISVKIDLIRLNKIKFNKSIESAHSLNSTDDRLVGVQGKGGGGNFGQCPKEGVFFSWIPSLNGHTVQICNYHYYNVVVLVVLHG